MLKEEIENTIICPKCYKIPLLFFIPNRPNTINIKCECNYNQIYSLSLYLSKIKHYYTKLNNQYNIFSNNEFYCSNCKELYNKKNIDNHRNHSFIHLNKLKKLIDIEKIENKTKKLYEKSNKLHLSSISNHNQTKPFFLHQIDMAYKINCRNLMNTYVLLLILIDNYKKHPNNIYNALNI